MGGGAAFETTRPAEHRLGGPLFVLRAESACVYFFGSCQIGEVHAISWTVCG